jgi:glycine dehydrogenase subunit 2
MGGKMIEKPIFEYSHKGKRALKFDSNINIDSMIPDGMKRKSGIGLPELSEADVVRHFTKLSQLNFGVDKGFYPLGSCTMKYNPKVNEKAAMIAEFTELHPLIPEHLSQGALQIMSEVQDYLKEITGMPYFTLQPAAGASGEFTGLLMIKKYHEVHGNTHKNEIIIPDSAHGTNPASVHLAGFKVVEMKSAENGWVDIEELKKVVSDKTAGLMITNPNTLGLFDGNILEIAKIVHEVGGLLHYDGANLNAIMGKCRPYDMGFDIVHLNLHKTFSTPHGGGGPGSGPVGVSEKLADMLPVPVVNKKDDEYVLDYGVKHTIGKLIASHGNFLVILRAWVYMKMLGANGLKRVSETAVLSANYIMSKLGKYFERANNQTCMHECVLSGHGLPNGIHTLDVAKRLLDLGFHAPTIYFPLIVKEAMMIEPTETEDKCTIDEFIDAMIRIKEEAEKEPELLKNAPVNTPVRRLDEVKAARNPILKYTR